MTDEAPSTPSSAFQWSAPAKRAPGRPKGSRNRPKEDAPPSSAKPSAAKPTATQAEIKQALATLESLYGMLGTGLLLTGHPMTATAWADQAEKLTKTNEDYLKASPRLVKMINSTGEVSGVFGFIAAHAAAALPVGAVFMMERASKAAQNEEAQTNGGSRVGIV